MTVRTHAAQCSKICKKLQKLFICNPDFKDKERNIAIDNEEAKVLAGWIQFSKYGILQTPEFLNMLHLFDQTIF